MKENLIIFLILISSFMVGCSQREINSSKLEERNSIWYVIDENKAFTGESITYFDNGEAQFKEQYKNGKLNGKVLGHYDNGQVELK